MAWAHPKYGHILASCSYDGKVLIWKEQQVQGTSAGSWAKVKEHTLHTASGKSLDPINLEILALTGRLSVNSVSWAPHELGAILVCASSDGKLSVLTFKSGRQYLHYSSDLVYILNFQKTMASGAPTFSMATQSVVTRYPGRPQPNLDHS